MDPQDEIRQLQQMLNGARAAPAELMTAFANLYAPMKTPRPEVLIAMQLLASDAGLAAECPSHVCRRAGLCQAEDVGEPACASQWPEALSDRMLDMAAGIELSAWCAQRRDALIHAHLTRLIGKPAPGRRKKPSD